MIDFKRNFGEIDALKNTELFTKILDDIKKGNVFPAIRNGYMSFYYKGGGLFKYEKGKFSTHIKYAFNPKDNAHDYITEDKIKNISVCTSFANSYSQIKEKCEKFGTIEAEGVSNLYKFNMLNNKDGVLLLDTEIAFYSEKNKDRIDLLLFDIMKKTLVFVEAKHFSNGELWARENSKPQVVGQIERYNKKILEIGTERIIEQYSEYVQILNDIFNTSLPFPEKCNDKVGLVIMGYDSYQKQKIDKLLKEDGSLSDINYYNAGKLDNIKSLYNEVVK